MLKKQGVSPKRLEIYSQSSQPADEKPVEKQRIVRERDFQIQLEYIKAKIEQVDDMYDQRKRDIVVDKESFVLPTWRMVIGWVCSAPASARSLNSPRSPHA